MNEPSHGVGADKPEKPEDQQDNGNGFEHVESPFKFKGVIGAAITLHSIAGKNPYLIFKYTLYNKAKQRNVHAATVILLVRLKKNGFFKRVLLSGTAKQALSGF
jgi:hypothetical protein